MIRSTSLDTDSQEEDRGDSTPGPEGKRRDTGTPPPRSARDPAEGKPSAPDDIRPAPPTGEPPARERERGDSR